jgi:hypothetical protein
MTSTDRSLTDESKAWHKLTCLLRFRIPERTESIEHLAKLAQCEVEWSYVHDEDARVRGPVYGVVELIRVL